MANDFAQVVSELIATEKQVLAIRKQAQDKAQEIIRHASEASARQLNTKVPTPDKTFVPGKELQAQIAAIETQGKTYRARMGADAQQKIAAAVAEAVKIVVPAP